MPPATESPFKRDEPAGRSAKWMWLAGVSASVWAASSAWDTLRHFDLTIVTLGKFTGAALRIALVILLFRAAGAASRCRQHRSFDLMAAAVRYQRPFWALLAIAGAAGSIALVVSSLGSVDHNRALKRVIDENAARDRFIEQNWEAFKQRPEDFEKNPEGFKQLMEHKRLLEYKAAREARANSSRP